MVVEPADVERLVSLLEAAKTLVVRSSTDAWPEHLHAALLKAGPLPTNWLYSDRNPAGRRWIDYVSERANIRATPYPERVEQFKQALFDAIDASITTTRGGIAATGSLLLVPTPDEPRLMSLVPPLHVALLERSRIVSSLADVLIDPLLQGPPMPSNIVLISGPSKTADIQQTLAYGAHGPKVLVVVLLEDA